MKLDNFAAVFTAAQDVYLKGESLVCEGHGVTVAIKPIESGVQPQIEVAYIDGALRVEQTKRFDQSNFPIAEFTQLSVAKQFRPLLKGGAVNHGS